MFGHGPRQKRCREARRQQAQDTLSGQRDAVLQNVFTRAPPRLAGEPRGNIWQFEAHGLMKAGGGPFIHQTRAGVRQFDHTSHGQDMAGDLEACGLLQHGHELENGIRTNPG